MAKTLEEIRGMNLQPGEPIQITLQVEDRLEDLEWNLDYRWKEIGYFLRIVDEKNTSNDPYRPGIIYSSTTGAVWDGCEVTRKDEEWCYINYIQNIERLTFKD